MFFKKKKEVKTVDIHEHLRDFLYDSQLVEAEKLAVLLGATPISDEGQDHVRSLSDARLDKIAYLVPIIHSYAHIVTQAMVTMEKQDDEEEETKYPEEFWGMMHTLLEQVAISVSLGVVSQSVELGLMKAKDK